MLSPRDVAELARQEGLGEFAEDLVGRVRAGWRLDAVGGGPARIGGAPDLAAGEAWPLNHRGVPMVFLAQIDCASLPLIDPSWGATCTWEHGGRLIRLFADLMDNPFEPGLAVALTCDPSASVTPALAPPIPSPWPPGGQWDDLKAAERFHVLPETTVACVPFLTAPETHPSLHAEFHQFDEQADRYLQWSYRLRVDGAHFGDEASDLEPWAVSHLLGEAQSIQGDVRLTGTSIYSDEMASVYGVTHDPALTDPNAWRVLLALHNDETLGLRILDGGAIHVIAPSTDLAAGHLSRLVGDIDSS